VDLLNNAQPVRSLPQELFAVSVQYCQLATGIYSQLATGIYSQLATGIYSQLATGI